MESARFATGALTLSVLRATSVAPGATAQLPAVREETGVEPRRSPRSGLGPRTALPEQGGVAAPPRMQVMSTCSFPKGAG